MTKAISVSGATGTKVKSLLAKGAKVIAGVHSPEKAGTIEALGGVPYELRACLPAASS